MTEINMDILQVRNSVAGCFVGLAIGDALGAPVEMATREDILRATCGAGITGFSNVPLLTRYEENRRQVIGSTTDDTQLAFVVARSLIRCVGFDKEDCLLEHVRELSKDSFGWGKTTKNRVQGFKEWFESGGKSGINPHSISDVMSLGTGVAMKVAPIGAFYGVRDGDRKPREDAVGMFCDEVTETAAVLDLGYATHGDLRACLAGVMVALTVKSLVTETAALDREHLLQILQVRNRKILTLELTPLLHTNIKSVHVPYPYESMLSTRIGRVFDHLDMIVASAGPDALMKVVGQSTFSVLEVIPYAVGILLRHPTDFRAAVCEAINVGGDTDTLASIVGAMVGANVGRDAVPMDLQRGCRDTTVATRLAHFLIDATSMSSRV